MFRFVRNQKPNYSAQALMIQHEGQCYYPCIHHAAIAQDRAVGKAETFCEHRHDLYHLVVYVDSTGAFSLDGETIEASPGTVVCVSPGQWHDFVTHRQQAVYSEVTFSLETISEQLLNISFENLLQVYAGVPVRLASTRHISVKRAQHLESLIQNLTDHARSGAPVSTYCCQRSLAQLLDCLIWSCTEHPDEARNVDERLVKVHRYIEQNYTEPILVEELASVAGMSKGYLFRAYKKAYSQSPLAYQQQLRIEAAKTLLRVTGLRCNEIAVRCGYDNVYFFHRLFKRTNGITPGQYRKQWSEAQ